MDTVARSVVAMLGAACLGALACSTFDDPEEQRPAEDAGAKYAIY